MPWIPARSADKLVSGQCLKMEVGKVIRVESFKGDRWVEIKNSLVTPSIHLCETSATGG